MQTPVTYSPETGWIAHVPCGMPEWTKRAFAEYVERVNMDRWRAATGTKREMIGTALRDLRQRGITFAANADRGVDMFKATVGTGRTFSHG